MQLHQIVCIILNKQYRNNNQSVYSISLNFHVDIVIILKDIQTNIFSEHTSTKLLLIALKASQLSASEIALLDHLYLLF